jgi:phage terminase large subunit
MTTATQIRISKRVYNKVYRKHLNNLARTQIYYGGSSSGKSVFLAKRTVRDVLKGGRNYLVCRAVAKTIKRSVFQEIKKVIKAWKLLAEFKINESDLTITCGNGYQILFAGLDDVEKLKSITPALGVITDIWLEEATEAEKDDVKQLSKRQRGGSEDISKRMTLSFNPILQTHWIYTEYFESIAWTDDQTEYISDELSILKTTYKDNRFLTRADVADLENETDSYFYNVYTLGNWGVLGDVIFTNWKIADLADAASEYYLPDEQRTYRKHGLDFGFSSDPAALPATHYDKKRKRIYIYGELYELGLTNDVLATQAKQLIGGDRVTCDSSEPKSIQELRMHGVNAHGAKKGKDSVLHGIQWLQQQTIIIDKRCVKTKTEIQQYQWKKDKDGKSIRQPTEKNNHIIDGLRYGYEDEMITVSINTKATVGNYIGGVQQTTSRPGNF